MFIMLKSISYIKDLIVYGLSILFFTNPFGIIKSTAIGHPSPFLTFIDFIATCKGFLASVLQITPNIL